MHKPPDFIAKLTYYPSEQSGRKLPIHSGYSPALKFGFHNSFFTSKQLFINKEIIMPGESVEAEIWVIPRFFPGRLIEGMTFEFCEDPRRILGTGKIIKILNESLKS